MCNFFCCYFLFFLFLFFILKLKINSANGLLANILIPNRAQMFNVQMGWSWNIGQHANDLDRDGVKRRKDKCQETDIDFLRKQCPGLKKKELVDKQGCDRDDDKDGVINCLDECPETPEGAVVNSAGCTIEAEDNANIEIMDIAIPQDSI